jgi:REP-associated tyrosine transposase
VVRRHDLIVHGYAVMGTHFHAVVRLAAGSLSAAMQELVGGYARWWNKQHDRFGHAFRNHYDHRRIESQEHLIATIRYVDLNPVAARMVERPEDFRYTSYRAHVGLEHPIAFLAQSEFLKLMGPTPDLAREAYRRFVSEGHGPVSDTGLSEWP